jgi:hypothetical protein
MGISLSSGLLAALSLQSAPPPPQSPLPTDSARAARLARVAADSTDGQAWFDLGRAYVQAVETYHAHRAAPDTVWAGAALDSADDAFERAARWTTGTRLEDSARVLRVFVWGEKAYLAWEAYGAGPATDTWRSLPDDLWLPPVLEELGENLLRACPRQGLLLTAGDVDTQASWYMRFARGLRPDLLVVPLGRWRADSVFRGRVLRDLKAPRSTLRALAGRRPLCATTAFERAPPPPPAGRSPDLSGLRWSTRSLMWVAGPERAGDRVPPQDFVFAALRLALDQHETWAPPAIALYRRAAGASGGLCGTLRNYGVREEVGCR